MRYFILILALITTNSAWAGANTLDPAVQPLTGKLRLQGEYRLYKLFFHVYDISLWLPPGQKKWSTAKPFAIDLKYAFDIDQEDFVERTVEEWEGMGLLATAKQKGWLKKLPKMFPTVVEGDRICGVRAADGSTHIIFNGKPHSSVADPEFTKAFFAIWLGPKTSEPDMRDALFAGERIDD